MEKSEFDNQILEIEDGNLSIELKYERQFSENKDLVQKGYLQKIEITDTESSNLGLRVFKDGNEINSVLIIGIIGGIWLFKETGEDKGQTVKLSNGNLILSLGFNLVSIQIPTLQVNWNIVPDPAEIFEFYNLKDDILLRGELQIHRIDFNGEIKWSYGGTDIWVNIDGKQEITILEDKIKLVDFNHDEYVIDFDGNSISNKPSKIITEQNEITIPKKNDSSWWKFWKDF